MQLRSEIQKHYGQVVSTLVALSTCICSLTKRRFRLRKGLQVLPLQNQINVRINHITVTIYFVPILLLLHLTEIWMRKYQEIVLVTKFFLFTSDVITVSGLLSVNVILVVNSRSTDREWEF